MATAGVFLGDHMQTRPNRRLANAPCRFSAGPRRVGLVDDEFNYVPGLPAFDAAGRPLGDKLTRDHHSEAIALFRFLKK